MTITDGDMTRGRKFIAGFFGRRVNKLEYLPRKNLAIDNLVHSDLKLSTGFIVAAFRAW